MDSAELEGIEIDLLLEAVFRRYGYDFRQYARASCERRVRLFQHQSGCASVAAMIPRLLHDEAFFEVFVSRFSIPVTELFRDPAVYRVLREQVFPVLATFPFIKVWHAGCATGEEAYSLAIFLEEAGIYDRCTLFATDFNDGALAQARLGIYPTVGIQDATRNYRAAGGTDTFAGYYVAEYDHIALDRRLGRHLTFANHNLVTDGVFTEAHLILCRNVLIYFNRDLQNRVLRLFEESLVHGGFLCLGTKESLSFSAVQDRFEVVDAAARIYRKLA